MNAVQTFPERPVMRRGLVGPAALIGLGLVFLANNLGWLGWEVWGTLWRLWPLLLIAVGVDLLIGRRSALASVLIIIALLGAIMAAVWWSGAWWMRGAPATGETVAQSLGEAARADVAIGMSAGTLRLHALDGANELIAGSVQHTARERLVRDFTMNGDTAVFSLRSEGAPAWGFPSTELRSNEATWDLGLNPRVPMNLTADTGAGTAVLDLQRLHITTLEVNIGVGTTTLTVPAQGRVQAQVNGGVGATTIIIPAGVAAQITTATGLGAVNVLGEYQRADNVYRSPGYDSAANRVDLRVSGGVGSITIRR